MAGSQYSKADRAAPITTRPARRPQDTPFVGSKLVVCACCGTRDHANRGLLKRGQNKIPSCNNCRGVKPAGSTEKGVEGERKLKPRGSSVTKRPADKGPAVPPTDICQKPRTRGPNEGQPATGTVAGYIRHYRNNEKPCNECRAAMAAANKAWRTR